MPFIDPHHRPYAFWFLSFLLLIALLPIIKIAIDPIYIIWSDRLMIRTTELFNEFQTMGAENNGTYNARTPGGALYYLMTAFTLFTKDPDTVSFLIVVVSTICSLAIYLAVYKNWGHLAAIAALIVWISSPITLDAGYKLYNPAIGLPLVAIAYYLFVRYFNGHTVSLPWLVFVICVAAQTHISYASMFLVMGLAVCFLKPPSWRLILISCGVILVAYLPYLVDEAANGFVNTQLYIQGRDEPNPLWTAPKLNVFEGFFYFLFNPVCINDELFCRSAPPLFGLFKSENTYVGLFAFGIVLARIALAAKRTFIERLPALKNVQGNERLILAMGIILLAGIAGIFLGRGFSPYARYFVFVLPPIAIIIGICVSSAWQFVSAKGMVYRLAGQVFIIGSFAFANGNGVNLLLSSQRLSALSKPTAAESWAEIGQLIYERTGMNHEDIKARAVFVDEAGNVKEIYNSYLLRQIAPKRDAALYAQSPQCIAIVDQADTDSAKALFDDLLARAAASVSKPAYLIDATS